MNNLYCHNCIMNKKGDSPFDDVILHAHPNTIIENYLFDYKKKIIADDENILCENCNNELDKNSLGIGSLCSNSGFGRLYFLVGLKIM